MIKTIWKFPLQIQDQQVIQIPKGAQPLSLDVQNGEICLWAQVDTTAEKIDRTFYIVGTGNPIPEVNGQLHFLGTVQTPPFVWHIFSTAPARMMMAKEMYPGKLNGPWGAVPVPLPSNDLNLIVNAPKW